MGLVAWCRLALPLSLGREGGLSGLGENGLTPSSSSLSYSGRPAVKEGREGGEEWREEGRGGMEGEEEEEGRKEGEEEEDRRLEG